MTIATAQSGNLTKMLTEDFQGIAERVDKALKNIESLEDENAKMHALGLKTAIEDFHKFALTKIIQKLKSDPNGKELLFELVDEPSVYALLQLHGIIKQNLDGKITQVLDLVRPYMQSHGGDVEFVRYENSTAYVKLHGSCNGCSQSAVTLRDGVEEALKHNIPEIQNVEVVADEPSPALIQIESLKSSKTKGWIETLTVEEVPSGTKKCFKNEKENILIINIENRLSAFRNECPHQGLPLDGGMLEADERMLTCPWHGFKFDASSGECLTAPAAQLESFPLRVENGIILVRPS